MAIVDPRILQVEYDTAPTNGQVPIFDSANGIWKPGSGNTIPYLGDAGGTANALTLTADSTYTAYSDGDLFSFKATADNTASATVNINSIGATTLRKQIGGTAYGVVCNDVSDNQIYIIMYSSEFGGTFLLVNPSHKELIDLDGNTQNVANTTTTTTIYSVSVLGRTLGLERGVEFEVHGLFDNQAGSNRTFIIDVTFGSTKMYIGTFLLGTATTTNFFLEGCVKGRASTTSQIGIGQCRVGGSTTTGAGTDLLDTIGGNVAMAETSTSNLTLLVEISMSIADVTTSVYHKSMRFI